MKKIAVGDLGEFWYGDYKEPFVQLEGAQPDYPQGALLKADDGTGRLLCPYCRDDTKPAGQRGKAYHNLTTHVFRKHGMRAADFKDEVGLLQKSALVSETLRQQRSRTALRTRLGRLPGARRPQPGTRTSFRTPNPEERKNKTGTCYAQVLEVGRQLLREGRFSGRELARRGIWPSIVKTYFGDLDNFRRALGADPRDRRAWADEQMLIGLLSIAEKIGHTPARTDLRGYGLPSPRAYAKHFGSYSAACERVGLPINKGTGTPSEVGPLEVLTAYSKIGVVERVARMLGCSDRHVVSTLAKYGIASLYKRDPRRPAQMAWAAELAQRISSPGVPT